jgi:hypothetical protein
MTRKTRKVTIKGTRICLNGEPVGEIIGSKDYSGAIPAGGYRVELTHEGTTYTTSTPARVDTFGYFRDAAKFARTALATPEALTEALTVMRAK